MPDLDPYATAKPLLGSLPQWITDVQEQRRIASYALYESIYWGAPDTFKLISRGAEDKPIYIPSGRQIVETMHRYLAPKLSMNTIMRPGMTTTNDVALELGRQVITDLFRRERFASRFNANKRYGLIRGDWAFHLYADPTREPGSRMSIFAVDPASLFPIYDPLNVDNIIGWHVAEQFTDNEGKVWIRRLTYRKTTGTAGPSPITSEIGIFKVDDWGGPGMSADGKPEKMVQALQTLPSPIDHLPIYVIPNFEEPGMIWGSSEMRGLERIMAAINQSISDEELSIAMDGLGVWITDAGTPQDDNGDDTDWNLGPARVVEVSKGSTFKREDSRLNVAPYQSHLEYLGKAIDETMALSAVAKGKVDVQVAESGIALVLELAPLLSRAEEKEQTITDTLTNMFYDVAKWFVAYEGGAFNALVDQVQWIPVYGAKIPANRKEEVAELLSMAKASPQILPISYVRDRLRKLGYEDMPDETALVEAMAAEQQLRLSIQQDAFGARADAQINADLAANGGDPNADANA